MVRSLCVQLKAPEGQSRVVGVDLFSHEDYLIGDYVLEAEAFQIADDKNSQRSGPMDDVYYVYNDKGKLIRGQEQEVSP